MTKADWDALYIVLNYDPGYFNALYIVSNHDPGYLRVLYTVLNYDLRYLRALSWDSVSACRPSILSSRSGTDCLNSSNS